MGSYDHPVLWSVDRKRCEEQRIAREGLAEWKKQKEIQRINTINERKEVSVFFN